MLHLILSPLRRIVLQVLLAFFFVMSLSFTLLPNDANSGTNQLTPELLLQRILIWFLFTKLFYCNLSSKFASTFFRFYISPMIKNFKACSLLIKEITDSLVAIQGTLHFFQHIFTYCPFNKKKKNISLVSRQITLFMSYLY